MSITCHVMDPDSYSRSYRQLSLDSSESMPDRVTPAIRAARLLERSIADRQHKPTIRVGFRSPSLWVSLAPRGERLTRVYAFFSDQVTQASLMQQVSGTPSEITDLSAAPLHNENVDSSWIRKIPSFPAVQRFFCAVSRSTPSLHQGTATAASVGTRSS